MPGDRTLTATGGVGAAIAAICCATPLLAVVLGTLGLTAWLAKADHVVIPALLISLALVGVGLYRQRATTALACCDPSAPDKAISHE
jgi:mercuric ion transport protein